MLGISQDSTVEESWVEVTTFNELVNGYNHKLGLWTALAFPGFPFHNIFLYFFPIFGFGFILF